MERNSESWTENLFQLFPSGSQISKILFAGATHPKPDTKIPSFLISLFVFAGKFLHHLSPSAFVFLGKVDHHPLLRAPIPVRRRLLFPLWLLVLHKTFPLLPDLASNFRTVYRYVLLSLVNGQIVLPLYFKELFTTSGDAPRCKQTLLADLFGVSHTPPRSLAISGHLSPVVSVWLYIPLITSFRGTLCLIDHRRYILLRKFLHAKRI